MEIGFYLHRVRRPPARSGGWEEFGWLRLGSGFRYTEIADSWRLDFIYTEIADALVVAGLARR